MKFVDLNKQYQEIKQDLLADIEDLLESSSFILGNKVENLEAELGKYCGSKHSLGVANGTDALQIALMALGVKAGDEVITSPFTFCANAEMITLLGARPPPDGDWASQI